MSWFDVAWHWYLDNATVINPLGTFVGAVGAFVTAATLAWTGLKNARTAVRRHEEQTKADRERRITETFSKATEQLASDKIEARLGAIYTLERISRESPEDYWVVMETLTGFVREHTRWKEQEQISWETLVSLYGDENSEADLRKSRWLQPKPATDIAAILTVIDRRDKANIDREKLNYWMLDFNESDLRGALLPGTYLENALFDGAHFEGAVLAGACLKGAHLIDAHLEGANLVEADLESAFLSGAHLEWALLYKAHLERATLYEAHFERADLEGAHLEGADLEGAHLEGALLEKAKGLVQDQITRASGNSETTLPRGLTRPEHWIRVS